jgi:hypothetical protein
VADADHLVADADVTKFMLATRHGHDTPALLKLGKAGHSAGPIGGDIFVASHGSTSVIATWCSD